ncbi:uncharacterized protein LOC128735933 [Sabethes cyaneus]|uniref:uncharacterized protein LOC128735933 n=1 Tax=Sabethes cyaneus TaxID=53552 RepID=UPI00237D7B8D|nr:uncharacterized protein LOC128735933 [Sabethes cyaneus]
MLKESDSETSALEVKLQPENSDQTTPVSKKTKKKQKLQERITRMEQLDVLVHRRGLAKGKVTRIFNILHNEDEVRPLSEAQIRVYLKKVETAQKEYEAVHEKILALISADDCQLHDDNFIQFDELKDEVTIMLEEQLSRYNVVQLAAANASMQNALAHPQAPVVIHQPLRMPIPTFDGRYESWPKFKAMFKDLVDKSPDPPAVKLYHLDKALMGNAAGLIDAKTINEGNYTHAWKILEERYENKRHTIDTHIHGLLNLKKMFKENHTELRALLDECTKHIEALKFLEQEFIGVSDLIVVHLLATALDKETRRNWEATIKRGELPNYQTMIEYLKDQCFVLERCDSSNPKQSKPTNHAIKPTQRMVAVVTPPSTEYRCEFCGKNHQNFACTEFKSLTIQQRLSKVRESGICFNCLRKGHRSQDCPSDKSCSKCKRRHHTLLHIEDKPRVSAEEPKSMAQTTNIRNKETKSSEETQVTTASCCDEVPAAAQVLLLTAVVDVIDANNRTHPCRVLLDSGSQANLISNTMVDALKLNKFPSNVTVAGVNCTRSHASLGSVVQIRSRYSNFHANISCLVAEKITADLPTTAFNIASWNIPSEVQLADPEFHQTGKIDMLIGNQLFLRLLLPGEFQLSDDLPILKETRLGWVVGGVCNSNQSPVIYSHSLTLEQSIQRFWSIEELPGDSIISTEETECEEHFCKTHRRDGTGRYIVQLPLKESVANLSDSRALALRRFLSMEKRLSQQPDVKEQYDDFMTEYEQLGHCKEVDESKDDDTVRKWYLPHHAVLRPSSTTTKCRVVFDASAKVDGRSLNDVLKVGALNQESLLSIVLRFRIHHYVLCADIAKMYRQIVVDSCHSPLQRVFWRKDPSLPLRVLELTTVTYGTASAPFLATRVLLQLAIDEEKKYPLAAKIVKESFYVDNALFGFDELAEALEAQSQLIQLLQVGGFHLHKWSSNCPTLLDAVQESDRETFVSIEGLGANDVIKTLGLLWDPTSDKLLFVSHSPDDHCNKPTKRQVLSLVASMFDPLGLVAPVVLVGKLLMRELWNYNLDWDECIPAELEKDWKYFLECISEVSTLLIPRQVIDKGAIAYEIHGFADASQHAYGACVYIRSILPNQSATMKLLTAKSKIVPKGASTIPRKELLAAVLLSRLVRNVLDTLNMSFTQIVLWSDSQIVLAWLRRSPEQLQVYVRNRVCIIDSLSKHFVWQYVQTNDNPADLVSRGQSAKRLAVCDAWWSGPTFLRRNDYHVDVPAPLADEHVPELKVVMVSATVQRIIPLPVFEKFSCFRKLQRVLSYVLRFIRNCQKNISSQRVFTKFPTIEELRESIKVIVRVVQYSEFAEVITCIQAGEMPKNLKNLSPFLDDGLLRVGGRLRHSSLPFTAKHQWILPRSNRIVEMIVVCYHRENMHIGPTALLASIRRQFWIIQSRSMIRKVTRSCVHCFKFSPVVSEQLMGDLPPSRCKRAPTFQKVGVDFAGPFLLRQTGRKAAPVKGYISIFVCLVTKGIHLEPVENLSTDAFIAALQRFVSRRGIPEQILSDNGTNFVGAKHELHMIYNLFRQQLTEKKLFEFCQQHEIQWKMIPPNAPHMGGLWEAGVKSTKSILKKGFQSALLNMMEFTTLLCQVEAQLNSRPLYVLSEDPADPEPLTPGHFIADGPLTAIPEPSYEEIPINRLSRWQYVQLLRESFWKRWSRGYLQELQTRAKWTRKSPNARPGMVVLVKEDNLPPQCWRIGKIEKTYLGADNLVRVADVRTKGGVIKRPIHKLAPIPILENETTKGFPAEDVHADSSKM